MYTWSSIELEWLLPWARCSSFSLSAGRHHSEAAGPRLRTAQSIAKELLLQLEKYMLPTVATVSHCRQRRQAHEHFVSLLWWHQPQHCGFVCLAHRSLWLQRGRCDQIVAYKGVVSGTGISDLTRPSSHLLVSWEPWNRRMFRCQNDVEKYVRDVCSWSCSGDKSTKTVRDLLRHVMLPFWQVNQTCLRLCHL